MHIVSRRKLVEFAKVHADAYIPLDEWFKAAKSANWQHLEEVKQVFSTAEAVGNFTVFNIKGNRYRLIVDIVYSRQRIYVKYILTHAEYDKGNWKNDPYY